MEHLSSEHEKEVVALLESINGRLMKLKYEADQYQLSPNLNVSDILIKAKDAMVHNVYLSKRLLIMMTESRDCHMTPTEEYQCKYELVRIYLTLGPLSHALTHLQSVKQLSNKLTPKEIFRAKLLEGDAISCVGVLTEAQQCYSEALLLVDKKDDPREWLEASIAVNICLHAQGRLKDAIDGLMELLTYEESSDERCLIGCIHRALGNVYRSANKFHEAEKHLDMAVVIATEMNDVIKMNEWAADLGRVYRSSGLHHKALEWQNKAYEGTLKRGDVALLGSVCGEIGFTNYSLKQPNHVEAIRYLGIRYILARDVLEDKASIRWCLNNLGKVYHSMDIHTPAIECFQRSLELVKGTGDLLGEGTAYGNLGSVLRDAGRYEEAVKYHKLYLVNATSRLDIGGEAIMLRELAFDHWLMEDYTSCREYALRGLLLVEEIRSTFTQSDDQLKVANHEKNESRIFNILQLVLVKLGQYIEALLVSEMSRGRAVFDLMAQKQQDSSKFKTLATDLIDTEAMIFNSTAVQKKSDELRQLATVLSSDIIVYSIIEEPVVSVERRHTHKQKWLYIWVVNESKISFTDKPITNSVFDLNLENNYLTSLKRDIGLRRKKGSGNNGPQTVSDKTHNVLPKEATPPTSTTPTISAASSELTKPPTSDVIMSIDPYSYLIEPVKDSLTCSLKSINRLVIMPCRFLHLVPFASLKDNHGQYLVETYVLSYAQSFSILSLLMDSVSKIRSEGVQRLSSASVLQPLIVGNPSMPFEDADDLKGAETEAIHIHSIMGGDLLTGVNANKVDVTTALTGRPLIHLATHALLGDSVNEHETVLESDQITRADTTGDYSMKGSVVLAKSSESCTGLLTSSDIQRINLSSCQLVTLSCCRSARGTISGDGVLGLSRALIVGGAKCIVNTLWAIEDEATVHLMRVFYTKYKETSDAPLALREAMLHLISNGFHVNQWSAFNVTGVSYGMIQ